MATTKKAVKKATKTPVKATKKAVKGKPVKKARKVTKDPNAPKPMSKGELYKTLAENTGTDKKVIAAILDELTSLVYAAVAPGAVGKFTIPNLCKFVTKATPAKPEREGINRFTGEKTTFKAKPASFKVKVLPVKTLKDAAVPTV